jgi:hypothetical protein
VVRVDQHKSVRLLSAVIGTSAVLALGVVAVAVANEQAGTDTVRAVPEAPATTTTTPPTAPLTSVATPTTTASTPAGYR